MPNLDSKNVLCLLLKMVFQNIFSPRTEAVRCSFTDEQKKRLNKITCISEKTRQPKS